MNQKQPTRTEEITKSAMTKSLRKSKNPIITSIIWESQTL